MRNIRGFGAFPARASWLLSGLMILFMLAFCGSAWAAGQVVSPPRSTGIEEQRSSASGANIVTVPVQPIEAKVVGHVVPVPGLPMGQYGPWMAPHNNQRSLDDPMTVWVDDDYSSSNAGGHTWGVDAFASIQAGILAVAAPGGVVNVYPGVYNETAPNSYLYSAAGPYQFGLFVGVAKSGITIQGVDAGGVPITAYTNIGAEVKYTATNNFGYAGVFVEGDNVTLSGLWIHKGNGPQEVEKTIEVIGDAFTLRYCKISDWNNNEMGEGYYPGVVWFDDPRYDTGSNRSHIHTFTVSDNYFAQANECNPADGTGVGWPISGRVISNNTFDANNTAYAPINYWGATWSSFSVAGATITGNHFLNCAQYIKARGTYDNSTMDWASYWNNNFFDTKVAHGTNPPSDISEYTDGTYNHIRRIGATINGEIAWATAGDIVLAGAGSYVENIVINKSITLNGAGESSTKIYPAVSDVGEPNPDDGPSFRGSQVIVIQAHNVTVSNLTVDGDNPALTSLHNIGGANVDARNGILDADGGWNNMIVHHCTVKNIYLRAIYERSGGSGFNFHHNTVQNVAGGPNTLAMFNYGGSGTFAYNTVSNVSDGIASNHSRGTLYEYNVVTNSHGYGIHTDNNGDGGGTADEIRFNTVSGATNCWGIMIFFPYLNATAHDNSVSGTYIGLTAWGGTATGSANFTNNSVNGLGVGLIGAFATPGEDNWGSWQSNVVATFTGNSITGCPYGLLGETDESIPSDFTAIVTAHGNSLAGNTVKAVYQDGGTPFTLDASGNWWGSNIAATVSAATSGHVDFSPYLDNGTDTDPVAAGFQGDFHTLDVTALGYQIGSLGRIQEGINAVSGSTVNVAAGTYNECVHITQPMTLHGMPGAIIQPDNTTPLYDGGVRRVGIYVDGISHVTVDGFEVSGSAGTVHYGIYALNGDYCTLTNNVVHHIANSIAAPVSDAAGVGIMCFGWGHGVNHNLIQGNTVYNCGRMGIIIDALTSSGWPFIICPDNRIAGNTVHDAWQGPTNDGGGAIQINGARNCSIAGNEVYNTGLTWRGIYLTGSAGTANRIDSNSVHNNPMGIVIATYGDWINYGSDTPGAPTVHHNSVYGNTTNFWNRDTDPAYTVDATRNYWGSVNYYGIRPKLQIPGPVNFMPWCNADFSNCDYTYPGDIVLSMDDPVFGCSPACLSDGVLRVAFHAPNFRVGEMLITLPDGIAAAWTGTYAVPPSLPATNLAWTHGDIDPVNPQVIHLSVFWGTDMNPNGPSSVEEFGRYIAELPIHNTGATSGAHDVPVTSMEFHDVNDVVYTNLSTVGTSLTIDCGNTSTLSLTWNGTPPCSGVFGAAADLTNKFHVVVTPPSGATAADLPASAFVDVNGTHIPVNFTGNPNPLDVTWPDVSQAAAVFAALHAEGNCTPNVLTLHSTDTGCNEATQVASLTPAVRVHTTGVTLNVTPSFPGCYNAAGLLAALNSGALVIGATGLTDACGTVGGTLTITPQPPAGGAPYVFTFSGDLAGFPGTTYATAVRDFIINSVPGANGATYSYSVVANDCAGHTSTPQAFSLCVDVTPPAHNAVTFFDARPANEGAWLSWTWDGSNPAEAYTMEVWRSKVTSGAAGYPTYTGFPFDLTTNYITTHPADESQWVRVVEQTGAFTPETYGTPVQRHQNGSLWYWKATVGTDANPDRDVYRFVTFVKDQAGNWSVSEVSLHTTTVSGNADRATNYWLGDFTPTPENDGDPMSRGRVNSEDLTVLSTHYFQNASLYPYCDISYSGSENDPGKGTPHPNGGIINFYDLVPFSFNYGMVSPTGFVVRAPQNRRPFEGLSSMPVVNMERIGSQPLVVGDELHLTITVSGNIDHRVKVAEAELQFDRDAYEFVSAESGEISTSGVPFTKTSVLAGRPDVIGLTAAACGEQAGINGDFTLATVTFRVKAASQGSTSFALSSIRLADAEGGIMETSGASLAFGPGAILPNAYVLYQNYPNPFNPTTTINFDLKDNGFVTLDVYNVMGQKVLSLVNGTMNAGRHVVNLDAHSLASGVYVYKLQVNGFTATRKMMLMR